MVFSLENYNILLYNYVKILLDENKMKKEEDEAKIFNTSEIDRYKVIPSKFTPNTLNELGGMIEAKKSAQEFIIKPWLPKYRNKFIENDVQMPNGFMLYGPPGCGKTYLAMAIANEINVPMYRVNLGQIGSSKGHETEANLIKLFSKLEDKYNQTGEPSLLFLDELDSICGNRAKMHTDWKRDEVNTVLQLANNAGEKGIILIGATNFIDGLDPAILRTGRFDKKIEISFPTEEERIEILSKMLKNKPMGKIIIKHIPEIAKLTEGKTCSDLNAIVQSAFRNAIFKENLYLNINDIKEAIKALDFDKNKDLKLIGFNR